MLRLLKADLIKMRNNKSIVVCMVIAALLGIGMAMLYNYFWQERGKNIAISYSLMELYGMDTTVLDNALEVIPARNLWAFVNSFLSDEVKWILSSICISAYIAAEFHAGTFRNSVARGFSRTKIYLSKLMVCIFEAILVTVAYVGGGAVTAAFLIKEPVTMPIDQILLCLVIYLLLIAAMASVFMMLSVLFRKTGIAVAVAIAAPMLFVTLFNLLIMADESMAQYLRLMLMETFLTVEQSVSSGEGWSAALIGGAYLVISTAAGLTVFHKAEIR